MLIEELSIGDHVLIGTLDATVTGLQQDNITYTDVLGKEGTTNITLVSPKKITPELLKANGFREAYDDASYDYILTNDQIEIGIILAPTIMKRAGIYVSNKFRSYTIWAGNIHYKDFIENNRSLFVHELQHLMAAAGFKIQWTIV